jgi:hypothetical protein
MDFLVMNSQMYHHGAAGRLRVGKLGLAVLSW